jgi:hypothetical protein
MRSDRHEDIHAPLMLDTEQKRLAFADAVRTRLTAELSTLPPTVHTVIFSSEHCHSRLVHRSELERLRELLREHFAEVKILVYLRRQDQVAVSQYSTAMKAGQVRETLLPLIDENDLYYNYEILLERWAAVFSEQSLQPRIFSREDLIGGSLIEDFCRACGIPDSQGLEIPVAQNQSLRPAAQEFLRQMNFLVPLLTDEGRLNPERSSLVDWVASEFSGTGRLPAREDAIRFVSVFAASNERLRQRFFPERAALFSNDFASYPEREESQATLAAVMEVAAALWCRSLAEIQKLRADVAFKEGCIARIKKRRDEAERHFAQAVELNPEHSDAKAQLARLDEKRRSKGARKIGILLRLWP